MNDAKLQIKQNKTKQKDVQKDRQKQEKI